MNNLFKISKGIEVEKLGKKYLFPDMCSWAKETSLEKVGKMCIHPDCIKAFWYNKGIEDCRKELLNLTLKNE